MEPGPLWRVCTQGVGVLASLSWLIHSKKHHSSSYLIGLDHGEKASDSLIFDSYLNFPQ